MIGFEEACPRVAAAAVPVGVEPVPLEAAWDRILAAPVIARRSAPAISWRFWRSERLPVVLGVS